MGLFRVKTPEEAMRDRLEESRARGRAALARTQETYKRIDARSRAARRRRERDGADDGT